jgi:hypothetical protein
MPRVAYLNPYLNLAEDQAFHSLRTAALGLGVELVSVTPAQLKESDDYDFLISTSASIRKTTSHPTYLSAHAPRSHYVDNEAVFSSTLSYDGYLCISDSLARLFSQIAESRGLQPVATGFYYNNPQKNDLRADLPGAAAKGELALCYFGTNWDSRAERLFARLAAKPYMRIYGPEAGWRALPPGAYKGSVPFDGMSVQKEYARYGAGLVCLSQEHLLDDIVSNRIFEIASAGACAICPDTPWMRENFGDSVFYYEPFASTEQITARIDEIMAEITADPAAAQARAAGARQVFETRFHAAALLQNALDYHRSWLDARTARASKLDDALIDVVIRTGGRSTDYIRRAIASIDNQSAGRFRLIVVRYKDVDLDAVLAGPFKRIAGVQIVECPGGNRSRTLVAGLAAVTSPYFALLDDDDYLLDDHFQGLLQAMAVCDDRYRFAYSDVLQLNEGERPPPAEGDVLWDNGITLLKEGPAFGDIHTLLQRFAPHCFLATSNCLERFAYGHWQSHTAEDVLLFCEILRNATPLHAPGSACVYAVGRADASDFWNHPERLDDELSLVTGISQYFQAIESKFPDRPQDGRALIYPVLRRLMETKRERIQAAAGGEAVLGQWAPVSEDSAAAGSLLDQPEMVFVQTPLSPDRLSGNGLVLNDGSDGKPVVVQPQQPWELSLIVDIGDYALDGCTMSVAVIFDGMDEAVYFGVTDTRGDLIRKVSIPSNRLRLQAATGGLDGVANGGAALQCGSKPPTQPFRVHGLHVGYRLADLARYFGLSSEAATAEAVTPLLRDRLERQIVGRPAQPPLSAVTIDIRGPRSGYTTPVEDGRLRDGAPRRVRIGAQPWDYVARIYMSEAELAAARWVRVELDATEEPFYVFVTDSGFAGMLSERVSVRGRKQSAEIWLNVEKVGQDGYLVFQSSAAPHDRTLGLRSVQAVV